MTGTTSDHRKEVERGIREFVTGVTRWAKRQMNAEKMSFLGPALNVAVNAASPTPASLV